MTAHIANLKWTQPRYARQLKKRFGPKVDYQQRPAEDFANLLVEFGRGRPGRHRRGVDLVELRRRGLRLSAELLGPEYSMSWNTLDTRLKLFFSREVRGRAGEDLLEKQNAEQGLMPVVANEASGYGYENEDRHFVRAFLGLEEPRLTLDDGLDVVKLLMTAYQSAESGRTLAYPPRGLGKFVPAVARGKWRGRSAP